MAILAISQRVVTTLIDISYVASDLVLRPIGWVESPVTDPSVASRQGDEGAPDCWLVFDPDVRPALDDLRLRVQGLEAIDGTPIVDIKPVLEPRGER
jgi:tRNA (Thr-GGU) A37 N-methylase